MKHLFLAIIFCLILSSSAFAAKAIAVITGSSTFNNQIIDQVSVSEDSGIVNNLTATFFVNFASSPNQINTDIKQQIRDILVGNGVVISVNNILLFGGAQ